MNETRPRSTGPSFVALREKRARKEFIVLLLVEPGTLDVEQFEARHADGERERVDRELCDRLVGARVGFVSEDMDGVVSDLQEVEVARDATQRCSIARGEFDAVLRFEFGDLVFREPDGDLDRDRARVVREHEVLQRLVA